MSTERVTITASLLGQSIQNVLHFNNADGALTGVQIANEIRDQWITPITAQQSSQFNYLSILVQRLPAAANVPFTLGISIPGALGDLSVHPVLCVKFQIRTGTAGKHGLGRVYISGNRENSVLTGLIHPGNLVVWTALAATLSARFKSGGSGPITLGVFNPVAGGSLAQMTSITVPSRWGIQRRRNIGVGI